MRLDKPRWSESTKWEHYLGSGDDRIGKDFTQRLEDYLNTRCALFTVEFSPVRFGQEYCITKDVKHRKILVRVGALFGTQYCRIIPTMYRNYMSAALDFKTVFKSTHHELLLLDVFHVSIERDTYLTSQVYKGVRKDGDDFTHEFYCTDKAVAMDKINQDVARMVTDKLKASKGDDSPTEIIW